MIIMAILKKILYFLYFLTYFSLILNNSSEGRFLTNIQVVFKRKAVSFIHNVKILFVA